MIAETTSRVDGRLRVLHFSTNAVAGHYFPALARHHDRDVYQLTFASLSEAGELQQIASANGLGHFALNVRRWRDFASAARNLRRRIVRDRFDIVQTHLLEGSIVGLSAARLANTPLRILTSHHTNDSYLHFKIRHRYKAFAVDRIVTRYCANRVIALSSDVRATLQRHYGVRREVIEEVGLGFDFSGWQFSAEGRGRVRAELGVDNEIVFGSVGRLNWIKDFRNLIEVFALLRASGQKVKLVLVGEGEEAPSLRQVVHELGVETHVVFAGYRTDIPDVLSAFDVYVNCSLTEACNQGIVEALRLGLPVIATRVGAAVEHVGDCDSCLVEPGNSQQLFVAMQQFMRRAPVDRSPKNVALSGSEMTLRYEELYRQWLTSLSPRSLDRQPASV